MTQPLFNILLSAAVADPGALEIDGVCRVVLVTSAGEFRDARGPVAPENLADAEIVAMTAPGAAPAAFAAIETVDRTIQTIATRLELEADAGDALAAAIARAAAALMLGKYRALCGLLLDSKGQTIALRQSLDRNAKAFRALEAYHKGVDLQRGRLVYANGDWADHDLPPARHRLRPGEGPLRQRLPVESGGLNLVRLFLGFSGAAPAGEAAAGGARLRLIDEDMGETVCEWRVPEDGARAWRRLGLREGYLEPFRLMALEIEAESPGGVEIGLSDPLASDRYGAGTPETGPLERAVAMELRAGLPGVAATHSTELIRRRGPGRGKGWLKTPLSEIAGGRVAAISDTAWAQGFKPVTADEGLRTISCHPPPGGGVTIAHLACQEGVALKRLDARIALINEKSKPVDFAIAAGLSDPVEIERRVAQTHDAQADEDFWFSGWTTLTANESRTLELSVEGACAPEAVLFLTRMRDGGGNDFAWAQFTNAFSVVQAEWENALAPAHTTPADDA